MPNKKEINKFNQRQYERMIALIENYKNHRIGIHQLIGDLEALIIGLENAQQDRQNLLLSHWGVLEDVYAVVLDKEISKLDQDSNRLIEDTLNILSRIINDELFLLKDRM